MPPRSSLSLEPPAEQMVLFVATFTYEPNRAGLRLLIEEVLPKVWAELPDVELTLIGRGLDERPSDDPRVHSLGYVEDLRPFYAGVALRGRAAPAGRRNAR